MTLDYTEVILRHTAPAKPPLTPEITLHLAERVTPLWTEIQALLSDPDAPPPFWAFAWAGGQACARYLLDHPDFVRGKRVLDFASGGGIGGIAAAKVGAAHVFTCDIDPFARVASQRNAAANAVQLEDWGKADQTAAPRGVDVIIAGDVCYEHIMAHRALAWLRLCAAAGIMVLLGDPGRAYAPKEGIEELARMTVPTSLEIEETPTRDVTLWRVRG